MKRVFSLFIGLFSFASVGSAETAGFDLTLETGFDSGNYFANFHEADAGTSSVFAIGFQIDITELNGAPASFSGPLTSFCTELQEPIGVASYTHTFAELGKISRGRAGEAGTASSAIPVGGIGATAAARVRALFDNRYQSSTLTSWGSSLETQAFQLALWEATHDTDLSLSSTSGSIYVGAQSGTPQTDALALAQTWLDELTGVTNSYASTTWDIWALENVGNPEGVQDILFATQIGSGDSSVIGAAVPEPASALLLLSGGILFMLRRRRQ